MRNIVKFLFSSISNSQGVHSISVSHKNVKLCINILKVLVNCGFLRGFKVNNQNNIDILLKYYKNKPVILNIFMKNDIFLSYLSLCKIKDSNVVLLLSTTQGIITHKQAIKNHIGGYLVCKLF